MCKPAPLFLQFSALGWHVARPLNGGSMSDFGKVDHVRDKPRPSGGGGRQALLWFLTAGYAVDRKFEASLKEKWGL